MLQTAQQVQDLTADRDVERRHRLVANDQLGLDGERAGNGDALPLPARELVRIALRVLGPEADGVQEVGNAPAAIGG